jgi:hypothetical protein
LRASSERRAKEFCEMSSGSRGDILGRVVGMLVFLVGVCLLVFVFMQAFQLFGLTPEKALGLHFTGDPKKDPLLAQIGSQFGLLLLKVAFLFIMALAASLISQRGINLYFSAMQGSPITGRVPAALPQPERQSDLP